MNSKIHNIFPTSVYRTKLPKSLIKEFKILDLEPHIAGKDGKEHPDWGTRSKTSYILNKPEVLRLKNYVLEQSSYYGHEVLGFESKEYRLTQSWLTFKSPQSSHSHHMHQNSMISGVIFYGPAQPDTPGITFHRARPMVPNVFQLYPKYREDIVSESKAEDFEFPFIPGTMLLFPSWLAHSVRKNPTVTVRKSLAFNIISKYSLGDEIELTELKYEE